MPLGKSVARSAKDLRIAVLESNPLVRVSADTAAVLQATVKLLTNAGAKVNRAQPDGLDWQQGWDDWCDLFFYQSRALQPLSELEGDSRMIGSSNPSARSAARTARLGLAAYFAVLDGCERAMRQCETFLEDFDAWLMPVMPNAAFIRQSQDEPLEIDGVGHPYFFAGTSYNFLANLTGQPSVVLPCGFSRDGLPIGLQLTGRKWRDIELLNVAMVVEKLLPSCPVPPAYG